jgi:DNA-binding GntR family transcriptional regulator
LPTIQRRQSLHEQTYQTLRSGILSGDLAPGERLVETRLAEQLQVSRTPIREAIRQLQREALVTADPSGGLRVASVSARDASQLYDCRLSLEQLAVAEACAHADRPQLQAIETCVLQAEQLFQDTQAVGNQRSELGSYETMLELDYRFHRAIAESADNRWLVSLLDRVFDQMMLLRVQTTRRNPRVLEICGEHRRIFEAIAQRQVTPAVAAITQHLQASKTRTVKALQATNTDTETGNPQNIQTP